MDRVFIIIVNWNRKDDTLVCLQSLSKMSFKNIEPHFVIVDNNSSDGSLDLFNELKFKGIELIVIANSKNLGFAGGNNIGIKYALDHNADYVLLINNDTYVDKDLLVHMLNAIKHKNNIAAVSPKIYFAKGHEFHKKRYKKSETGRVIWAAGGEIDWSNIFGNNRGVDEVDCGQYNTQEIIDFATGACVLYSSKALRKIGMFNDKYFMYFEDADLSQRLLKGGWKILYEPQAVLWHKVAQSSGIGSSLNDYFITRNRLMFGIKYAPLEAKLSLIKQNVKFLVNGRKWQKIGVRDYFLNRFYKGSWK